VSQNGCQFLKTLFGREFGRVVNKHVGLRMRCFPGNLWPEGQCLRKDDEQRTGR
jgi:hypothetical protein